ncbi:NAD-glutamate dehydrogenase [Aquicella lusitana]|uniref:Glutamate dehydrogenase (NAD) n=1 Tax=Aquicella lusitana TaxID=254246 RepID=A0A370GQS5_9COXI|nr:NAD-glutamate dehydrogenase [Aquicella lusitana]RDI46068.1 glutamate dehydrogenase (NAD) [Aquicella lusitana]VVC73335.1 NAD-specific glutamate dehydrogenase [Aquicella lusitana]
MAGVNNRESQNIINQIKTYVKNHAPAKEADLLEAFAERYFSSIALDDLKERTISDLYGILLSHWKFIYQRSPGEAKVRIFNPEKAKDGWKSTHTIIQISHDDIPFLVDSTRMAINRYDYQIHFIIHFGGLKVMRDNRHRITGFLPPGIIEKDATSEAPIYIEIDRIADEREMSALQADIERVLADVRVAVADWRKMVSRVEDCLKDLESNPPSLDLAELAESRDFLRWLVNNNFTFLGARDYKLIGNGTNRALQIIPGSGLGVLRDETFSTTSKSYAELPPQARKMALSKNILIIAKTNTTSTVHRRAYTDYIGVKRFNEKGELIGERRFIGLYTSTAYHSSPRQIPFLRHKVDKVLEDLGFPPDSHDGKEAVHIIETLPRDDLFQASHEELLALTLGILQLKERKRIRLLVRRDAFYRYFSCLVFVPREIFNTELVYSMQDILMEAFKGIECTYTTYFSDSVLARIHFLVRVNPRAPVDYDIAEIEKKLITVSRSWSDELKEQLIEKYGESEGLKYYIKYHRAFPASYTEYYSAAEALGDIEKIEGLSKENALGMLFSKTNGGHTLSLKLFHVEETVVLSDVLPILENMGLRIIGERPHEVKFKDGKRIWVNDFDVSYSTNKAIDIKSVKDVFQEAFTRIWFQEAENDGFNRLVLDANLTWQETAMLRAYTKYLRQTGFTFSQSYIEQALINNVEITKLLVQLFILRFDPVIQRHKHPDPSELITAIEQSLDAVSSLDEDRILRRLLEVIQATIRTNYFQKNNEGTEKPYISFKFDPSAISDLPLPKPKYEIFVYSPRVEGVHLRAGKVARGGLRWSDRREDFRTEVLGLMKAQQVKNTVIVPEGAKGGFFVKTAQTSTMSRDEYMKEVIYCYSTFIKGLLDITDNIKEGVIIPPANVVRYDEDDPYLVVAADKGTATFSDIANGIAQSYGFWLDDAFASGGSAGYDHKKMGITSRGVWVSVKRHFRELEIDPEKDNFTVVGIGDMSGDVFGNGMLLSRHIKLIGAFNHMHIFLDPDPDPEASYEERKRLFGLPRSSWSDYNPDLISKGGGVFNRSAKSIKLTPELKRVLNTKKDSMVPNELIRTMLKAPVDLIWNGGIGTFVKSAQENHADVGDRTNDGIRIDAVELNAKVIAEGGNLGLTQLARIEYSLQGGIVNTDFIDNSAGVDCSDHEVNIKILLNRLMLQGDMTREQRNKLLEKMTDEVAELVLLDNYEQTQMLSLEASVSQQTMDLFRQYMNDLEKEGRLNRRLEYLPDDKTLIERKASNKPLTRPEIAILLAYSKMYLKQDILASDVPEEPYFDKYLLAAFPKPLREKYLPEMKEHSLRREIVATQLCKAIADRMGINFVERLQRETGASTAFIIRAFTIADSLFHMEDLWHQITALDYKVSTHIQYRMMLQIYYLIRRATRWFLRNRKPNLDIQKTIDSFSPSINELIKHLPQLLDASDKEAFDAAMGYLTEQGVPEKLARSVACCNTLFTSLDIVESAQKYELDLFEVAKTYYLLGNRLELNWLRELMNSYVVENQWDELARAGFRDDLDRVQRKLSARVLTMKIKDAKTKTIEERINIWINRYQFLMERWQKLLTDVKSSDIVGFVTYSVVLRELFDFAQAA